MSPWQKYSEWECGVSPRASRLKPWFFLSLITTGEPAAVYFEIKEGDYPTLLLTISQKPSGRVG